MMGAKLNDRKDWFNLWYEDKKSMMDTMARNIASDLSNGYDYFGLSITNQRNIIRNYKSDFDAAMDTFKTMDDSQVNRWCFYDMKKRGVIE